MLTRLEVDGFKSLNGFSQDFSEGLNVLVGPNGAGKTAITQAIGLVAATARDAADDYVLSIGGSHAVFTKCPLPVGGDSPRILIRTQGRCAEIPYQNVRAKRIIFEHKCEFVLDDEGLAISDERLVIRFQNPRSTRYKQLLTAQRTERNISVQIHDKAGLRPFFSTSRGKKTASEMITAYLGRNDSILGILASRFFLVHWIREELAAWVTLNIDPHVARQPVDALEPVRILSNGGRLAAALADLSRKDHDRFNELTEFLQIVYPRYGALRLTKDPDRLLRSFEIADQDGVQCSAASLSDGTVKILALLTAILAGNPKTCVVEEPENFLHPWACKSLIEYLRSHFVDAVCVLTTHSETVLNEVEPHEIILCTNRTGVTRTKRIPDPRQLARAIAATGFGCGYHYVAGSLGAVPDD